LFDRCADVGVFENPRETSVDGVSEKRNAGEIVITYDGARGVIGDGHFILLVV